jgi:glycyl-tRNA synthetase alpha subunit
MKEPKKDAISWVRESRRRISERFGNDPRRLVEYYIELQEQYRDRMISDKAGDKDDGKAA